MKKALFEFSKREYQHARASLLLIVFCALLSPLGCDDDATHSVHLSPGEEIEALWRPADLAYDPSGRLFVAEQATMRVRRRNLDGSFTTILDANPLRIDVPGFSPPSFSTDFGRTLEVFPDGELLVASRRGPILLVDPEGARAPYLLSGDLPPAEGLPLTRTDLSTLSGATLHPEGMVLVLGDQIWLAQGTSETLSSRDSIKHLKLHRLAGDGSRAQGPTHGSAREMPLELGSWTALVVDDLGGIYFPEGPRLRYLRDGVLLTLTGEGNLTGLGFKDPQLTDTLVFDYEELRCNFGGWTQGIWHQGAPYFIDKELVRRFETTYLDLENGEVRGRVLTPDAGSLPQLKGIDFHGDTMTVSLAWLGTLLDLDRGATSFEITYGPDSWRARYSLGSEHFEPYAPQDLIGPQAITALYGGSILLANQPLTQLVMAFDRSVEPHSAAAFLSNRTPGSLGYPAMTSDGQHKLYLADPPLLVPYLLPESDDDEIDSPGGINVFRTPSSTGLPGPSLRLQLQSPLELQTSSTHLLYVHRAGQELIAQSLETGRAVQEAGPRQGITPLTPGEVAPSFSLDLSQVGVWDATTIGDCGVRLLGLQLTHGGAAVAASNPCSQDEPLLIAGVEVERKKAGLIAGGGTQDYVDGASAEDVSFEQIFALSLTHRDALTYLASVEAQGSVHIIAAAENTPLLFDLPSPCSLSPGAPPSWISALDHSAQWPPHTIAATVDGALWICRGSESTLTHLGDHPLGLGWTQVEPVELHPIYSSSAKRLLWIDAEGFVTSSPVGVGERERFALPDDLLDVLEKGGLSDWGSLDANTFFFSLELEEESYGLLSFSREGAFDMVPTPAVYPELERFAGGGIGLPSSTPLNELYAGREVISMTFDGEHLYFAVQDTASVWQLELGEDLEVNLNDVASLMAQGEAFFLEDSAMPMAAQGGRLWIGRGEEVLEVADGEIVDRFFGGDLPPSEGLEVQNIDLGQIRGLTMLNESLAVLGTEALVLIAQGKVEQVIADGGHIEYQDHLLSLRFETMVQPALEATSGGELLIPHPASHQVLVIKP